MGKKTWATATRAGTGTCSYPINSYNVSINITDYVQFADTLGDLTLDFYVTPENLDKAKVQFEQAKPMIEAYQALLR